MRRILLAFCMAVSIGGVLMIGALSDSIEPVSPSGGLEGHVGDYVFIEGIVSRAYETKGNVFLTVKGEFEAEIPLFYGIAQQFETLPKPGDAIRVEGVLERVSVQYRRQYWPAYSISVESCDAVTEICDGRIPLRSCSRLSLENAGCVYSITATVERAWSGHVRAGGAELEVSGADVADIICAEILITEEQGRIREKVIDCRIVPAEAVLPSHPMEEGRQYAVSGTVSFLRPYYGGVLVGISGPEGEVESYVPGGFGLFYGDGVVARGTWKSYYGGLRLVTQGIESVEVVAPHTAECVHAGDGTTWNTSVLLVENRSGCGHTAFLAEICGERTLIHLYAEQEGWLERMGKDAGACVIGNAYMMTLRSEIKRGGMTICIMNMEI